MNKEEELLIEGAGKKSKPKTQAPPVEAPNTLRSRAKGRILDLIAYGPIKGPVNGLKSVFLDDTPVENADGTLNFQGIDLDFVHGDPDQDVIPGFVDVSNPREINTEVKFDTPITRSLLNNDADAVLVTVRVPALVSTDVNTGNTNPASLPLTVQVLDGSNNIVAATSDIIQGKNTSPYERSYRLNIKGTGPFTVKVSRGDKESDKQTLQNDLYWSYLSEIIDIRQSYPNCAMFGISVDAELFGSSIPTRKYLLDLSIIKVPSNYNPETRVYTGFWDGTFKEAWSDNPAWCYYDLATHPVIGAGIEEVNKWALYEIGRYCDELVPDGYGGMEPRFTCNTIFSQSEEAITALNTLASVFRGMTYWGSDTVEPVADMPGPIRKIITPSDVIDGDFVYQGTSLKERHSVAVVMWNDPADQYEAKPEMVEDPEAIELLGWRDIQVTAVACTSRGQARRLGLWLLYSERAETQTVSFTVTAKHADFRPGDFFHLQDPYRAGARLGGKVIKVEGKAFTLDEVPAEVTVGWLLTLETEEGGLEQVTVASVRDNVVNVRTSPTQPVIAGASFALSSAQVNPQTFRVASVMEQEGSVYGITATAHDPRKYQAVEQGLKLPDLPTSFLPTGRLSAPTNLSARTYKFQAGGTENQGLTMGWTAPDDARVSEFMLDVKGPDDVAFGTRYVGKAVSFDIDLVTAGKWFFRVRSVSQEWGSSAWAESSIEITNLLMPKAPTGLVFNVTSNSVTILPQYAGAVQDFEFWRSLVALTEGQLESNATYLGTGSFFSDIGLKFDTEYFYYVRGVNLYGHSAWVPGQAKTSANVDEILEVIVKEQQETPLGQWFQKEITKISAPADVVGSVNNRVEGAIGQAKVELEGSITDVQQTVRDLDLKLDTAVGDIGVEITTKNEDLQAQLSALQGALSSFVNAAIWEPTEAYVKNDIVQWDGSLFASKGNSTVGVEPFYGSTEWEKIGDFVSLTDAIGDLALRVQRSETKVDIIEGVVTPIVSQLNTLSARWREVDAAEQAYLDAALEAWQVRADFSEEVKVRASEYEALSQRLTVFDTSLGDLSSSLTTLEQSLTTEIEAVAQSVTSLEGQIGEDISAAILAERMVRVNAEDAIATSIEALEVQMGKDITSAISTERTVRVTAEEALGRRIDTVVSSTEDNSSAIQSAIRTLTDADTALGQRIDTVTASTVTADAKAVAAKAAADAAQGTANTAKTDAATAAGIANSKGKTIIQSTAPAVADQLPQNLWIDITGGANTPKKWETNKWVAVTDKVAVDAANAAAVADGKAVAAKAAADAAAAVGTTNKAAIQAETTARTNADSALGQRIDTVTASTVTADGKAVAAKAAADAAQGTANTAKTDAATAAGIANSKGKTIIQSTAPAVADQLPQNLWIDITGGANTPKKWETNKWVAVTDKVAVDAANAAAVADGKAVAAKAAADAAAAVGTTNKAAIQAETTARTDADEALAKQVNTLVATSRERGEEGDLVGALDAWDSRAAIYEESRVRTAVDYAMAKRTTVLEAQVGEVKGSVTRVESVISTEIESIAESITQLKAQVNDDIGAALTEESRVRASEDESLSQRITALTASTDTEIGKNSSAIQTEITARTNADTALGQRIDTVTASTVTALEGVMDNSAAIQTEITARTNADTALASQINTVQATSSLIPNGKRLNSDPTFSLGTGEVTAYDNNSSGLVKVYRGVKSSDNPTTSSGELVIQFNPAGAPGLGGFVFLVPSRSNAVFLVKYILKLPVGFYLKTASNSMGSGYTDSFVGNSAGTGKFETYTRVIRCGASGSFSTGGHVYVSTDNSTKVSGYAYLAQLEVYDTTDFNGTTPEVSVAVQTIAQAQATTDGKASAMWGVKLKVNSNGDYVTAGVGLGLENVGGTLQSNFIVEANNFTVINGPNGAKQAPFTVQGDNVIIKSAFLGDATITMAKIGGDLYSTNYIAGQSGWRLKRDGTFEINTTVPGQGRTVINNKGMRVYDAANKIRVKIGDLT